MSTVPAVPGGLVAEILLLPRTVNDAAAVLPNFTLVAPVRFVPLMVTLVPPAAVPEFGLMLVTVGASGVAV
jgi:hypothetical protein